MLVMTLLLSFMPNSPRFLLSRGRDAEALRALAWLRGADTDIRWEFSQIQDNVQRQVREGGCEALGGAAGHWARDLAARPGGVGVGGETADPTSENEGKGRRCRHPEHVLRAADAWAPGDPGQQTSALSHPLPQEPGAGGGLWPDRLSAQGLFLEEGRRESRAGWGLPEGRAQPPQEQLHVRRAPACRGPRPGAPTCTGPSSSPC